MTDHLEVLKGIEELLRRGLIEEFYDEKEGTLKYRLTEKGLKWGRKLLRRKPEHFEFLFWVHLHHCETMGDVVEFLLWFIYHVLYGIHEDEAKERAKRIAKLLQGEE